MGECDLCPGDDDISFTCNHCHGRFCSDHRLPESHNCSELRPEPPRPPSLNDRSRVAFWTAIGVLILPFRLVIRASSRAWSFIPSLMSRQRAVVLVLIGTIGLLVALGAGATPADTDADGSVLDSIGESLDGALTNGSEAVNDALDGKNAVSERVGPPQTENPIKTVEGDGFLNTFTLYESGAARLEFEDDYSCYSRIAVGDTDYLRGSNLEYWTLPQDGILVVDMKGAVSKTKDPSNTFWLGSLTGKNGVCFGGNRINQEFTVPESWVG